MKSTGTLVLMGSGELTATMVEVHKELLSRLDDSPNAVFIDTPAGFQLNVDQISRRAVEYFHSRIQHPLSVASYKSRDLTPPFEAEQAFHLIKESDFIFIGPGSPTYTIRQLKDTPVPDILVRRIEKGGCLVAASAAALTMGRLALPVYEIYKVGEPLHWVEGLDIMGRLGINSVVVPHWNNAEGGTHDTRFCFMGESRFRQLEALIPSDTMVLGIDEHSACIIDFAKDKVEIRGIGRIVLRFRGEETWYEKGDHFPISTLCGETANKQLQSKTKFSNLVFHQKGEHIKSQDTFWDRIHQLETDFHNGLTRSDSKLITTALLEMDRTIWKAQHDLESEADIIEAREILRDQLVLIGTTLESGQKGAKECLATLVQNLLRHRETCRQNGQWEAADAIRDSLRESGISVEDTPEGVRWHMNETVK